MLHDPTGGTTPCLRLHHHPLVRSAAASRLSTTGTVTPGQRRGGHALKVLIRGRGQGDAATVRVVRSADRLNDLRRRLAGGTGDGSTNDRVTTDRLATMRRRLSELERTSEDSNGDVEVMAVEEEAHEIMASLENVRDLRPSEES